jgi:thiol-disulfide isomerase/thioredoxin
MSDPATARKSLRTRAIVVIIVISGAGGFFLQRRADHATAPPLVAAPPAAAAAAAPAASPARKPLPDVLPGFALQDRDGKLRKLADWTGRPLVVNFWATWCAPCVREIPLLKKFRADRRKQKVEVIGIAVDFREDVLAFATRTHLDYPLLIGEEDGSAAIAQMGVPAAFPFTVFADSKQRIVALKIGELHQDELDLIIDRVLDVDSGQLDLAAARERISAGLQQIATKRALDTPAATPPSTG